MKTATKTTKTPLRAALLCLLCHESISSGDGWWCWRCTSAKALAARRALAGAR